MPIVLPCAMLQYIPSRSQEVLFEVFTAVTMKTRCEEILGISSQRTSVASCSLCCS
jgi:hypothetical protein